MYARTPEREAQLIIFGSVCAGLCLAVLIAVLFAVPTTLMPRHGGGGKLGCDNLKVPTPFCASRGVETGSDIKP